jgi:hypothetical protein
MDNKQSENRKFSLPAFSPKNRRGDIPTVILVIGTMIICGFALLSFSITNTKVRSSFVGLELVEQLNSQIENNPISETSEKSLNEIFEYAKENEIVNRECRCGDTCVDYASFLEESASNNGIDDAVLLLSLMMQESECVPTAFSGSSVGLIQINLIHCGGYGLPSNKEECKKELMNNPQKNIEVGAIILKEKYDMYKEGKEFLRCSGTSITYTGWEAALRAYNGWGCSPQYPEQDNFVEEVMKRYKILKGGYLDDETTHTLLWMTKTTSSFSVEYKGEPQ